MVTGLAPAQTGALKDQGNGQRLETNELGQEAQGSVEFVLQSAQGFDWDVPALLRVQVEAPVVQALLEALEEVLRGLVGAASGAVVEVEGRHDHQAPSGHRVRKPFGCGSMQGSASLGHPALLHHGRGSRLSLREVVDVVSGFCQEGVGVTFTAWVVGGASGVPASGRIAGPSRPWCRCERHRTRASWAVGKWVFRGGWRGLRRGVVRPGGSVWEFADPDC